MKKLTKKQLKLAEELTAHQKRLMIALYEFQPHCDAIVLAYSKIKGRDFVTRKERAVAQASVCRTIKSPAVKAFYDSLVGENAEEELVNDLVMTREEALIRLSVMARTTIDDLVDFKEIEVGRDDEGSPIVQSSWKFKDSVDLQSEIMSSICEVTSNAKGITLKTHSQLDAIQKLSRLQGWETPKVVKHTGSVGSVSMKIDPDANPQKACETYMDVMRETGSD